MALNGAAGLFFGKKLAAFWVSIRVVRYFAREGCCVVLFESSVVGGGDGGGSGVRVCGVFVGGVVSVLLAHVKGTAVAVFEVGGVGLVWS